MFAKEGSAPAGHRQPQRRPTPKRTVATRLPTLNTSGTHAARTRRRNPPAYAFQVAGVDGQAAILSELTIGVSFPHVIATRRRHALGTLTVTAIWLERTARPALRQNGHERLVLRTTWGR